MLPKKVYLGKWQHAKDGQMIETLGITHIINISDSCDNYLEESHRKCSRDIKVDVALSMRLTRTLRMMSLTDFVLQRI